MTTRLPHERSLVDELNDVFTQDPEIDEIGLIWKDIEDGDTVMASVTTYFELDPEQHKLGIVTACLVPLFREAQMRWQELGQGCTTRDHPQEQQKISRALVIVSADHYSAWNVRKQLVVQGHITSLEELHLTSVVLTKQPKSIDTWAHRKWLVNRQSSPLLVGTCETAQHMAMCDLVLARSPRNYHCWAFRTYVMQRLYVVQEHQETTDTGFQALLRAELVQSMDWTQVHISDHSGWVYRMELLSMMMIMTKTTSVGKLLTRELERNVALIEMYPHHESLWCFRKFLFSKVVECSEQLGESQEWHEVLACLQAFTMVKNPHHNATLTSHSQEQAPTIMDYMKMEVQFLERVVYIDSGSIPRVYVLRYILWMCLQFRRFVWPQLFAEQPSMMALAHHLRDIEEGVQSLLLVHL